MQRNAEKFREMQRNAEKCRKMQRNEVKCREMQRNLETCIEMQICRDILMTFMTFIAHENVIFDILEHPAEDPEMIRQQIVLNLGTS